MTDTQAQWTSDLLLTPQSMPIYCDQVRMVFRDHREGFRRLAIEVSGDLKSDPVPGDGALQARLHAWRVARLLRAMESHTQKIVALARELERTYQRVYVELPKARERKAVSKELHKAEKAQIGAQSADALNRTSHEVLYGSDQGSSPARSGPAEAAKSPVFDLFQDVVR